MLDFKAVRRCWRLELHLHWHVLVLPKLLSPIHYHARRRCYHRYMQRPADADLMLQYLDSKFHIASTLVALDSSAHLDNINHVAMLGIPTILSSSTLMPKLGKLSETFSLFGRGTCGPAWVRRIFTGAGRKRFRNTSFQTDRISPQQSLSLHFTIRSIYWELLQCCKIHNSTVSSG